MIAGARADGLRVVWSAHVEGETDRHTHTAASKVSAVRTDILGMELSPASTRTEGLDTVSAADRQVVADAILAGVGVLAEVAKNPARTAVDVHRMLGRRHPHLTARFADAYEATPVSADPDQPTELFRGVACLRCPAHLDNEDGLRFGLCGRHQKR